VPQPSKPWEPARQKLTGLQNRLRGPLFPPNLRP